MAALVAGCASAPPMSESILNPDAMPAPAAPTALASGGYYQGDGPPATVPAGIDSIPGAEPRIETPKPGANKPYTVLGRNYVPLSGDSEFRQRGTATWYGNKYHGKPTASGELYDMYKMTAAHPTLPIPSYARVRNPGNGRELVVRINDRGPFHSERIIDLSYVAARHLGILEGGSTTVEIERLTNEAIRTGSWRRGGTATAAAPASATTSFPVSQVMISTRPVQAAALPAATTSAKAAPGFWVQLGAFRQLDGAQRFQRQVATQLAALAPRLALFSDEPLYKLQAGPYRSRQEAALAAQQVYGSLQLTPMIVQRR